MELKNLSEDANIIEEVKKDSIADELELEPGDIIISINGEKVKDIIDYKYMVTDDYLEIEIQKPNGEIWELEIEKEFHEDLGISFTNPLIDSAKNCRNNCIFCFIDQLPSGLRESLYFKDDDSRLSFLQGNFVTLTNMSEEEIERIIKYRISPINISVHTTNPELRIKMLNNKNAGKLYGILERFSKANIEMNCQIVSVPGVNDGAELTRTLKDLSKLYPSVKSVAIVPVGTTKYREGLFDLKIYDQKSAKQMIEHMEKLQSNYMAELGTRFAFLSDEFFIVAKADVPKEEYYEGFPQLENGVGLIRAFKCEIEKALDKVEINETDKTRYTIATGKLAFELMKDLAKMIKTKFKSIDINVVEVSNEFFGKDITVSGLLTATDLTRELKDRDLGEALLIPRSMMKQDELVFLDDVTLSELKERLGIDVLPVEVDGEKFIDIFKRRDKNE